METVSAVVESLDNKHFILIKIGEEEIRIPMSEDNPNEIKSAFNKLITRIEVGEFQICLEKIGEDLFSLVAHEYITQLNREILEVRNEMEQLGLVI